MDEKTKILWLKRVLMFNIIVAILVWGLPLWIGPKTFLSALKITISGDVFYMRMYGAVQLAIAYLLWLVHENPSTNRDVLRFNVALNGAQFLTIVGYQLAFGIKDQIVWFSALLMLFFGAAYYILLPYEER